jgi:two-component system cell cycle sensor histidine kinase/response regulator CckA
MASRRVLVIDDDLPTCILSKDILQRGGYCASFEVHAEAATTRVERGEPFDVAVIDIVMPMMTGDECARRLRVHQPELRILFLTGYPGALFQAKPLLWEGEAFLEKPCSEKALLEAVSLLLYGTIGKPGEGGSQVKLVGRDSTDSSEPLV